jgi:hypothetical protein
MLSFTRGGFKVRRFRSYKALVLEKINCCHSLESFRFREFTVTELELGG